ncbi:hypothetical protein K402DRAFT_392695 [Aulographum hederae CBS 113979]|uniref:BZIP domain-containing protein n=1 Tax=Aulographum hederae CBS 113979 TaxID=1176131 RepID=A0A6G1H2I1_9PEZI|nr:hypothetical protein K402DRAFT_392695 [Aulographum hederae CBS 113979]
MDSQKMEYWPQQASYVPRSSMFDTTGEISPIPSLSSSPKILSNFESQPNSFYQPVFAPFAADEMTFGYQLPLTPSDFGSADENSYCSPPPIASELAYGTHQQQQQQHTAERTHTTSGRRRAQNRAAQRAFRERKEKHARDLETQLAALSDKHRTLETSHAELQGAYNKLRRTVELLTASPSEEIDGEGSSEDVEVETEVEVSSKRGDRRRGGDRKAEERRNAETLRKVLQILHGEIDVVKGETSP